MKSQFLCCWNRAFLAENPPNGEYYSEDDDSVIIKANYTTSLRLYNPDNPTTTAGWYSISSTRQGEFFSSIVHLPNETSAGDLVMTSFEVNNKVLYWTCPKCSAKNNSPTACTVCGEPITPEIRARGLVNMRYIYPALFYNNYYFTQTSDPVRNE